MKRPATPPVLHYYRLIAAVTSSTAAATVCISSSISLSEITSGGESYDLTVRHRANDDSSRPRCQGYLCCEIRSRGECAFFFGIRHEFDGGEESDTAHFTDIRSAAERFAQTPLQILTPYSSLLGNLLERHALNCVGSSARK
jgi:hypothetical protein